MRILIIEDEPRMLELLSKGLFESGVTVMTAADGEIGLEMATVHDLDAIVLDIGLPKLDGYGLMQALRERKRLTPVLMLTAHDTEDEIIHGLDVGADDYLTKPFSFSELSARVRALMRRAAQPAEVILRVDNLELNRVERTVKRAGHPTELTPKEFALLDYLMRNAGRCVTRAMIIEHVWNLSFDTMTNVVDVYINYLRKKVDSGHEKKLIRTVRGVGYQIGDEA